MPRKARTRRVGSLVAATVLAGALVACSSGGPAEVPDPSGVSGELPADTVEQFQAAVEHAMATSGASGAIVMVSVPWAGEWSAALGTQTPAGGGAVSTDMTVKAGPITRLMTCDVLYALDDRGAVSVDDSVSKWTNAIGADSTITLKQLCDSTSGLRNYAGELRARWYVNPERVWNPQELIAYGLAQGTSGDPGEKYVDSDTGYVLLGIALERATGESMADLMETYVFDPLNMDDSKLVTEESSSVPGDQLSGLYSQNVDGDPTCTEPLDVTAWSPTAAFTSGGVVSTVADLARYVRSVADSSRDYDNPERFATMVSPWDDAPTWFAAGGGAFQAGTLIGQYGSVPGSTVAAFSDTETGLTAVVILNNSRGSNSFARFLSWQLAAIGSKVAAVDGETAPTTGYPWTPEKYTDQLASDAICPLE